MATKLREKIEDEPVSTVDPYIEQGKYTSRVADLTGKDAFDDVAGFNQIETRLAMKDRERFHCDQELYRRELPDGSYSFAWVLHHLLDVHQIDDNGNLRQEFFNKDDCAHHCIESERFVTSDAMVWQLRLEPGVWQEDLQAS